MANKSILVVGGGISGITAAVEAAEAGYEVYLVEKNSYLGGRVTQINEYFPKMCPPNCGLEINFNRIRRNPKVRILTMAEVTNIAGQEGNFDVTIQLNPRYVTQDCTGCNKCSEVCPAERSNDFNYGMDKTKAVYLAHKFAFPMKYVIDKSACQGAACGKCVEVCPYKAIDLNMQAKTMNVQVDSVIWATGWAPYDLAKISNYGGGKFQNVITNVMMERLAALTGPTLGKIIRPSDGKEPQNIAFVQCAGSRDENHQKTCSSVCCMASLKQANYVRRQYPNAKITVFYMDIRTPGKYEDFYNKAKDLDINFIKGKPSEIKEDPDTKDLVVLVENQIAQEVIEAKFDLVVLATAMAPTTSLGNIIPAEMEYDVDGYVAGSKLPGVYGAGCVKKPGDVSSSVQDATATVIKAIQSTVRR